MAAPNIAAGNHSDGIQSLNTGGGPQHNNNDKGLQINNSIFHGFGINDLNTDEATTLQKEKEDCLRSLSFEYMDARQEDISLAHPRTCDWFFATSQFQQWYHRDNLQNHNGVLWIKGHPGTGKSTLMKHTLRHLERELSETHIIAAHFFNARGDSSERTALSMLRSILYQLLEKEPSIYEQFVPLFRNKNRKFKTHWNWRESDLKNFLFFAIQHCRSKSLIVLVDALDECEEKHVRDVVKFLEELSIEATAVGVALNICLSSRHYPYITMQTHLELVVEEISEHNEDIIIYTRDNLTIRDKKIEKDFLEKASGVFMWAVLVIKLLNKAYDEGQIEAMHETLHKVPGDLEQVFEQLLIKNNPHKQETAFMLQFVLLARRLITPEELYFATIAKTTENIQAWDQSKIRPDDIRRRITNSSRGLIEVRKGDDNAVQFIHKSVNDFLIRNKRLQKLDPDLEVNGIGSGHECLRSCCMRYIMMIPLQSAINRKQIKTLASSYPFLQYASGYLLEHAEEANKQQIEQAEFLQCLIEEPSPLEKIRLLHNAFERFPGSGCIRGVSLLYMLAFHGYTRLTKALLDTKADANAQGGIYGTALQAAIAKDRYDIARLLLDKGADFNAQGGFYGNALQAAIAKKGYDMARLLLDKGADFNAQGGVHGNALHTAAARGSKEILKLLLQKGVDVNTQGVPYGFALHAAAEFNKREAAKFLLEKGANVNAQGGYYGYALQAAARYNNKELAELLLEKGANVNAQGGFYGYALHAAAAEASITIVELLLEEGADVNARGGPYGHALCAAVIEGNTDIVQILLENGADVSSPTEIYELF
ncbi:ankyrin repeat domain-containing protein [Trichoderma gamsii]|uniref:Ankyrin repeat domain-containing protein n=1 Tax=Trichoderma gamsii TaxID=398673 RepID=A0A2P4ZBN8_9HYPO|nr:ankyrin repeat domain-containing protein [Trichoderma gamsii]PON21714.1 ankyrin repeat domain-containing protein [Trichoderma gamsii]